MLKNKANFSVELLSTIDDFINLIEDIQVPDDANAKKQELLNRLNTLKSLIPAIISAKRFDLLQKMQQVIQGISLKPLLKHIPNEKQILLNDIAKRFSEQIIDFGNYMIPLVIEHTNEKAKEAMKEKITEELELAYRQIDVNELKTVILFSFFSLGLAFIVLFFMPDIFLYAIALAGAGSGILFALSRLFVRRFKQDLRRYYEKKYKIKL